MTTTHQSHVGTAFEYLLRLTLAHNHAFHAPHLSWEADLAPLFISASSDSLRTKGYYGVHMDAVFSLHRPGIGCQRLLWAYSVLGEAKRLAAQFHATGRMTPALIWMMFKVSHLEVVVRNHDLSEALDPDQLETPDERVVAELAALIELAKSNPLRYREGLYLSPSLNAQRLVAGASPDLIVDGWVCDVKTVEKVEHANRWIDQVVIYAALLELGGLDLSRTDQAMSKFSKWPSVIGVALYLSRHGMWIPLPLGDILPKARFEELKDLLCSEYLQSRDPSRIRALRKSFSPMRAGIA